MISSNDPRKPGGTYWNGYWRQQYEVLAMWTTLRGRQVWMTVLWHDGYKTTHCTAWDFHNDKILVDGPCFVRAV